jgi:hypothetical protein
MTPLLGTRFSSWLWIALAVSAPIAAAEAAPSPQAASAQARGRIAVLVLGAGVEADLADNLTEVLIANVARAGAFEIVGKEEFRGKLGVEDERRALGCIEEVACVSRAGAALGVTKVLAGTVGKRASDYVFSLSLVDLATGKTDNQTFKLVTGGVQELITVVGQSAGPIFEHRPEPGNVRVAATFRGAHVYLDDAFVGTTPVRSPLFESGRHRLRVEAEGHLGWAREVEVPSGGTLEIDLGREALPEQRQWPRYLAWGSLIGAAVAAGAGGFLGVLSQEAPTGATRRDQLADLDHKQTQATLANALFGAAGALAVTSGVTFFLYRSDIFGGTVTVAAGVTPTGRAIAGLRF